MTKMKKVIIDRHEQWLDPWRYAADDGVGYVGYGQVGGHVFRLVEWECQHPPMRGQEGPHQTQKNARYIKSAPKIKTKTKKKIIPGQPLQQWSLLQYLECQIPR